MPVQLTAGEPQVILGSVIQPYSNHGCRINYFDKFMTVGMMFGGRDALMHVAVGLALRIFGAALILRETRFFRDEDKLNERIGGRASRFLGQIQFAMFGAALLTAGLLLIFRKG